MSGKGLCSKIIEKRWRYVQRATVKYTGKTDFVSLRHYGEPCASRGARTVREGASTRRLPHDTRTSSQSKGHNGSYSQNFQQTGRELMTPDEVRTLDNRNCIILIRGENPIIDQKFDLMKHPNIKLTHSGGAFPYVHSPVCLYASDDLDFTFSTLDELEILDEIVSAEEDTENSQETDSPR